LKPTLIIGLSGTVAVHTETGHRFAVKIIAKERNYHALKLPGSTSNFVVLIKKLTWSRHTFGKVNNHAPSDEVMKEIRCLQLISHQNVLNLYEVMS